MLGACGDEAAAPVPDPVVSPAALREAYGLNDGNCYRYRSAEQNATVTVEGPNTDAVIGRTVYRWNFQRLAGGLPDQWFFDTESDGEIRLLRAVSGLTAADRTTRSYDDGAPVFYGLQVDRSGEPILSTRSFVTDATSSCAGAPCGAPTEAVRHEWIVQDAEAMIATVDGPLPGIELIYRRTIGTEQQTALYSLVPGRGFA
ncbi:MAG: hypothetical protein AAF449_21915, partial [Myxococcota bacterium]